MPVWKRRQKGWRESRHHGSEGVKTHKLTIYRSMSTRIFIHQWHLNVHRNLPWWCSIHTVHYQLLIHTSNIPFLTTAIILAWWKRKRYYVYLLTWVLQVWHIFSRWQFLSAQFSHQWVWVLLPEIFHAGNWADLVKSTHKGGNWCLTDVTQQQRPGSSTVTLTWHACKCKVHKLYQRYILKDPVKKNTGTKMNIIQLKASTHLHTHAYAHPHTNTPTRTHTHVSAHMHAHTHAHTHTHACMHARTHTHAHSKWDSFNKTDTTPTNDKRNAIRHRIYIFFSWWRCILLTLPFSCLPPPPPPPSIKISTLINLLWDWISIQSVQ